VKRITFTWFDARLTYPHGYTQHGAMEWISSALIVFVACMVGFVAALSVRILTSSTARRVSSLALRLESLEASSTEMHSLLKALETRDRMRKVRARVISSDGPEISTADPKPGDPGWKQAMRLKILNGEIKPRPG